MNPHLPTAYVNRAHARAALNDREAAIEDYLIVLDMSASDKVIEEARKGLVDLGEDPDDYDE
jgi:hypothetical protein